MYNLRSGALGRSLIAVRDSEDGARSVGVDVRTLKVLIFTVSAMLAGLGGALLAQQRGAFTPNDFDPLGASLPWFALVVVFGADSAAAAVVGAAFLVVFDHGVNEINAYLVPVGLLAAFLGRLPGGAAEVARRVTEWVITPTTLLARYRSSLRGRPQPALSERGRAALARVRAAREAPP
jgi:branched-chain amino acid transport system permease protein